jgi:predicted transposase/invertase (TIGR01784 family)
MKTDKWFYELFLSQPGMLAELMPGIEKNWEFVYNAPVVKEKEFRLDGVFRPVSNNPIIPMVFAEAQMQSDAGFYGRYFSQLFVYINQYTVKQDWRGLLILRDRSQGLGWEVPYTELLERRVTQLYLSDLREQQELTPNLMLLQLLVTEKDKSAVIGRKLLQEADTTVEFQRRLSLIETILANKFPELTKEIIMNMLDIENVDITQSRFYQEIIVEGLQEGRQKGLQEGRQKGLQEGEANLVIRQLRRQVGELPESQSSQIKSFPISKLEDLGEALLDFQGIHDLDDWLQKYTELS